MAQLATKPKRGGPFTLDRDVSPVLQAQGYVARLAVQVVPVQPAGAACTGNTLPPVVIYLTEADLRDLTQQTGHELQSRDALRDEYLDEYPVRKHLNFLGKVLCLDLPVKRAGAGLKHEHVSEADPEGHPEAYCPRCLAVYAEEHWPTAQGAVERAMAAEEAGDGNPG